jgi:hypothetical protein
MGQVNTAATQAGCESKVGLALAKSQDPEPLSGGGREPLSEEGKAGTKEKLLPIWELILSPAPPNQLGEQAGGASLPLMEGEIETLRDDRSSQGQEWVTGRASTGI